MQNAGRMEDPTTMDRALRLRQVMNEFLRTRTDQERDRTMQIHLAQARGASMNAYLLRRSMDFSLRIRAWRRAEESHDR
jgi:hypothetical protein